MPKIYEPAPLDADALHMTQRIIFVGGVLTLPSLFFALSGLLRYDTIYYVAVVCCLLAGSVLCVIGWLWARQVRIIELTDTQLIIKRRLGRSLSIPLTAIAAINAAPLAIDAPPVRWGSNVGVFGYAGEFVSQRYGRMYGMASNRDDLVALSRINAGLLVLSPANPALFVDDVRTALTAHERK